MNHSHFLHHSSDYSDIPSMNNEHPATDFAQQRPSQSESITVRVQWSSVNNLAVTNNSKPLLVLTLKDKRSLTDRTNNEEIIK